tara:strand:+ start:790 stop:1200 length:411 start_codon:yes stop_codon:yes gene_type:complete
MSGTNTRPAMPHDLMGNLLREGDMIVSRSGHLHEFRGYMWNTGEAGRGIEWRWRRGKFVRMDGDDAVLQYQCILVPHAITDFCSPMHGTTNEVRATLAVWYQHQYEGSDTQAAHQDELRQRKRDFQARLTHAKEAH